MTLVMIFLLTQLLGVNSLFNNEITVNVTNSYSETSVVIEWNVEYRQFKGFGTFAGRGELFRTHPKREELIDALFGENGLQLSVIRSTVVPNLNFGTRHEKDNVTSDELWIMKRAQSKHGVSTFIASTWSPPYKWKRRKGQSTGKDMNYLDKKHYADFANYMADFVQFYEKNGLQLYAISPQNEPEFQTIGWDGCVWWPQQTADFVKNYLKPTFLRRKLTTKIMIGENANWNVAGLYNLLTTVFLRGKDFDVYGSHGYSMPLFPKFDTVSYNTEVFRWPFIGELNKERWITEVSATTPFDPTMKQAIKFGVSLSRFLTNGDISGFVFWLGIVGGKSNEGLIVTNANGDITFPRVYHVYGQFSRYIKPTYIRVKATESIFPLFKKLDVVAFKDRFSRYFTVVIVNESETKSESCVLQFKSVAISTNSIVAYITNDVYTWSSFRELVVDGKSIKFAVPPLSVLTVTGQTKV